MNYACILAIIFTFVNRFRRISSFFCIFSGEYTAPRDKTTFKIVGTGVPDCPNRTTAGASPRPTKEVISVCQNEFILFINTACFFLNHNRTAEDVCPYIKKTSVYQLTSPKSVKGLDAAA